MIRSVKSESKLNATYDHVIQYVDEKLNDLKDLLQSNSESYNKLKSEIENIYTVISTINSKVTEDTIDRLNSLGTPDDFDKGLIDGLSNKPLDSTNQTFIYKIGYKTGLTIYQSISKYQPKTFEIDLVNGDTSDGSQTATKLYEKCIDSAGQFLSSTIRFITEGNAIHSGMHVFENISMYFQNISDGDLNIVFYKTGDLLGKFWFRNCNIVFEDIKFIIPKEIENSYDFFNPLLIPFVLEHSTITFKDCKFVYEGSSSNIVFLALEKGSSVFVDNCHFYGTSYTFAFGQSQFPNLLATNNVSNGNIHVSGLLILKDESSKWISYE